jgi:hypothetical protein
MHRCLCAQLGSTPSRYTEEYRSSSTHSEPGFKAEVHPDTSPTCCQKQVCSSCLDRPSDASVRQVYLQYRPHHTQSTHSSSQNRCVYYWKNSKIVSVNAMKKYKVGGAVQLHPFLTAAPVWPGHFIPQHPQNRMVSRPFSQYKCYVYWPCQECTQDHPVHSLFTIPT